MRFELNACNEVQRFKISTFGALSYRRIKNVTLPVFLKVTHTEDKKVQVQPEAAEQSYSELRRMDRISASQSRASACSIIKRTTRPKRILHTANYLFSDSKIIRPLQSSVFYLGQIPKVETLLPTISNSNSDTHSRLIHWHNIAADMHLASIRQSNTKVASRIFGDLQREISKRHAEIYGIRK